MKHLFIKKYWYLLVIIILIAIVSNFGLVFSSFYLTYAVQYLIDGINQESTLNKFYYSIIIIIGSSIAGYLLVYINSIVKEKYNQKVVINLKNIFLSNLNNKTYSELKNINTDVCHNWINNDIRLIYKNGLSNTLNLIDIILTIIFSIVSLAILNWAISIIVLFLSILCLLIPSFLGNKLNKIGTKFGSESEKYYSSIYKNTTGINNMLLLSRLDLLIKNMINDSNSFKNNKIEFSKQQVKIMLIISIFNVISQILVMMLTAIFSIVNLPVLKTLPTAIFSVTALAGSVFGSLQSFANGLSQIAIAKSIINKNIMVTSKPIHYKYNNDFDFKNLVLKNVSLSIDNKKILKNINLTFEKNKKYLIVGPSGCGKSSLISLLLKINDNYDGNILINNKELKEISYYQINKNMSYLTNKGYLFDDSIKNNITLFDNNINEKLLNKVLISSGCDFVDKEKINQIINDKEFSTGQLQRILVARSLYENKNILIYDEAFSNLDHLNALNIEKEILENKNLTFIHVTHHLKNELIKNYDQVIEINNGGLKNV